MTCKVQHDMQGNINAQILPQTGETANRGPVFHDILRKLLDRLVEGPPPLCTLLLQSCCILHLFQILGKALCDQGIGQGMLVPARQTLVRLCVSPHCEKAILTLQNMLLCC